MLVLQATQQDGPPAQCALLEVLTHVGPFKKKSLIRETKHLSTDADSSTDTTVGWTKNTQKPKFFEKRKKLSETQNFKNI